MSPRTLACALALLIALVLPAGAVAAQEGVSAPVTTPASQTVPPPGFRTSARDVLTIAGRLAAVRDRPGLKAIAYVWGGDSWTIEYTARDRVEVSVDLTRDGRVTDVWTGVQARAAFTRDLLDRTFPGWALALFSVVFLVPFLDRRRPRRALHADLLAVLSFVLPFLLMDGRHGTLGTLAIYPPLLYLLGRMLWLGSGRGRTQGPVVPHLRTVVLVVGLLLLIGGRVALAIDSGPPTDIGYASVVGADRMLHGDDLYVDNAAHGDTYGPMAYIAYIPFEKAFPWTGAWDDVPAARAAGIAFDLLTILALILLGVRLRDRRVGLALGWAWAAHPLTLFNLVQGTNDGLIAMLIAWTLVAVTHPAARGSLLGLAAAAKFFPAALIGAVWRGLGDTRGRRDMLISAGVMTLIVVLTIIAYLPSGGLEVVWNCTLGLQLRRDPDYSVWGLYGLKPLQLALEAGAVVLAVAIGFLPRGPRRLGQAAALSAAVTIALQVGAGHWFFFYVVWFLPAVLVALFDAASETGTDTAAAAAPAAEPRALVPA